MKLLKENIGSKLFNIGLSNTFLDMFPRARETKVKINRWNFIKLKKLVHSEGNYEQNKKTVYSM